MRAEVGMGWDGWVGDCSGVRLLHVRCWYGGGQRWCGLVGMLLVVADECSAYRASFGKLFLRPARMSIRSQLLCLVERSLLCFHQPLYGQVTRYLHVVGCGLWVTALVCALGITQGFLGLTSELAIATVTTAGIGADKSGCTDNDQDLHSG